MSLFSDLFSTDESNALPDWLQSGAAIADAGIDLYDRIAGGSEEPEMPPMRQQTPVAVPSFSLTPIVALVVVVVGGYLLLGISRRR